MKLNRKIVQGFFSKTKLATDEFAIHEKQEVKERGYTHTWIRAWLSNLAVVSVVFYFVGVTHFQQLPMEIRVVGLGTCFVLIAAAMALSFRRHYRRFESGNKRTEKRTVGLIPALLFSLAWFTAIVGAIAGYLLLSNIQGIELSLLGNPEVYLVLLGYVFLGFFAMLSIFLVTIFGFTLAIDKDESKRFSKGKVLILGAGCGVTTILFLFFYPDSLTIFVWFIWFIAVPFALTQSSRLWSMR